MSSFFCKTPANSLRCIVVSGCHTQQPTEVEFTVTENPGHIQLLEFKRDSRVSGLVSVTMNSFWISALNPRKISSDFQHNYRQTQTEQQYKYSTLLLTQNCTVMCLKGRSSEQQNLTGTSQFHSFRIPPGSGSEPFIVSKHQ